ncbi:hypothetical protein PHMEG_0009604 [Phytophthora megakarya]|uniref:Uncharacterized protein n=1 Tax=Phytophthora megakarya TaxID=4795 RepID=A0A225WI92_9STRA|nr:hypothetical protein PHMEG_0009604 [Phytophthora megakarya]
MCAAGFEHPTILPPSAICIPAVGAPIPSAGALVADTLALEHEAQVLRSHLELSTALNADLAIHAIIRHDQLVALYDRARRLRFRSLSRGPTLQSRRATRLHHPGAAR